MCVCVQYKVFLHVYNKVTGLKVLVHLVAQEESFGYKSSQQPQTG